MRHAPIVFTQLMQTSNTYNVMCTYMYVYTKMYNTHVRYRHALYNVNVYLFQSVHLGVEVRNVEHAIGGVQSEGVNDGHSVPH